MRENHAGAPAGVEAAQSDLKATPMRPSSQGPGREKPAGYAGTEADQYCLFTLHGTCYRAGEWTRDCWLME